MVYVPGHGGYQMRRRSAACSGARPYTALYFILLHYSPQNNRFRQKKQPPRGLGNALAHYGLYAAKALCCRFPKKYAYRMFHVKHPVGADNIACRYALAGLYTNAYSKTFGLWPDSAGSRCHCFLYFSASSETRYQTMAPTVLPKIFIRQNRG